MDAKFVYGMVEITTAVMFTAGILSFNGILWYLSNHSYFVTRILVYLCSMCTRTPTIIFTIESKLSISKP